MNYNKINIVIVIFNIESEGKNSVNVSTEQQQQQEQQEQQEGFVINLSKDQKCHYGSQFGGDKSEEGPGIVGKLQIIIIICYVSGLIYISMNVKLLFSCRSVGRIRNEGK